MSVRRCCTRDGEGDGKHNTEYSIFVGRVQRLACCFEDDCGSETAEEDEASFDRLDVLWRVSVGPLGGTGTDFPFTFAFTSAIDLIVGFVATEDGLRMTRMDL